MSLHITDEVKSMTNLFEYILIALACPLVLPMIESQESHEEATAESEE